MNPLISLIIPVYNVEKYLAKCMESVLAQTYDNFEAILVDDGSTDSSGKMCDEYAKKDTRVLVFHKENGGLSDARNYGVERAHGELVAFLDSDDFVSNDYLFHLYSLIQKTGADMACAETQVFFNTNYEEASINSFSSKNDPICLPPGEALKRMLIGNELLGGVSACSKLFPRCLLLQNPFPVGKLFEDLATTYKVVAKCHSIAVSQKRIYFYLHRPMSEECLYGLTASSEVLEFVKKYFPEAEDAAHVRYAHKCVQFVPQILADPNTGEYYFKIVRNAFLPHFKYALRCKEKGVAFKAVCILIWMGYYPLRTIYPLAEKLVRRARKQVQN